MLLSDINSKGQPSAVALIFLLHFNLKYDIIFFKGVILLNIQIFGTKKCFDTKKAERWFKERKIKYQFIDMKEKGMSKGEFSSIKQACGIDSMINPDCKDKELILLLKYLSDIDREEKVFENQQAVRTPIVRNGKSAVIGYCPEVWEKWE